MADPNSNVAPSIQLEGLSKQSLIEDIESHRSTYLDIVSLTPEEYAAGQEYDLALSGFDDCPYLSGAEVKGLLVKFFPDHLRRTFQHTKAVFYDGLALEPTIQPDGVGEKELDEEERQGNFLRLLASKPQQPIIRLHSPEGMSHDPVVLKVALVQALVHDYAHGIIDYFAELAVDEDDRKSRQAVDWLNKVMTIIESWPSLTVKSAAYREHPIAYFPEEFAELVRLNVFNRQQLHARDDAARELADAVFSKGLFRGEPIFPTGIS